MVPSPTAIVLGAKPGQALSIAGDLPSQTQSLGERGSQGRTQVRLLDPSPVREETHFPEESSSSRVKLKAESRPKGSEEAGG